MCWYVKIRDVSYCDLHQFHSIYRGLKSKPSSGDYMSIGPGLSTLQTVLWTPIGPEIKRGLKILYSKAQWSPKTQITSQGILLMMHL